MQFYTTQGPLLGGIIVQALLTLLLIIYYQWSKKTKSNGLLEHAVETVYEFFDEVLGKGLDDVKHFVTNLFFIFLIMNMTSLVLDMFGLAFPGIGKYIMAPTGDIHFPLGIAIISILYLLYKQVSSHGGKKTLLEYIPITGKGLLDNKIGDIALSLFIGLLDIVGLLAKIISLGARMFGNILSGGILARVVIGGLGMISSSLLGGLKLPLLIPIILIAQSLLVGVIQSFVFPLLVAIFIRIASE